MWTRLARDIGEKVDSARTYALPLAERRYLAYSVFCGRLWYLAQTALPTSRFIRPVKSALYSFFWSEKTELVTRPVVCLPRERGGWGFPCVDIAPAVLQLKTMLKILRDEHGPARSLALYFVGHSRRELGVESPSSPGPCAETPPSDYRRAIQLFKRLKERAPQLDVVETPTARLTEVLLEPQISATQSIERTGRTVSELLAVSGAWRLLVRQLGYCLALATMTSSLDPRSPFAPPLDEVTVCGSLVMLAFGVGVVSGPRDGMGSWQKAAAGELRTVLVRSPPCAEASSCSLSASASSRDPGTGWGPGKRPPPVSSALSLFVVHRVRKPRHVRFRRRRRLGTQGRDGVLAKGRRRTAVVGVPGVARTEGGAAVRDRPGLVLATAPGGLLGQRRRLPPGLQDRLSSASGSADQAVLGEEGPGRDVIVSGPKPQDARPMLDESVRLGVAACVRCCETTRWRRRKRRGFEVMTFAGERRRPWFQ
ncbi:hypothetical protein ISCGN_031090 [Ixodes scapularis]